MSLAFLDIDDQTGFNARHGWETGTLALQHVGDVLSALGPDAIAGHYGGDEFAVVLPGTARRSAIFRFRGALKRIAREGNGKRRMGILMPTANRAATTRPTVHGLDGFCAGFPRRVPTRLRVHASIGGTTSSAESTPSTLITAAHRALVAAKESGGYRLAWTHGGVTATYISRRWR